MRILFFLKSAQLTFWAKEILFNAVANGKFFVESPYAARCSGSDRPSLSLRQPRACCAPLSLSVCLPAYLFASLSYVSGPGISLRVKQISGLQHNRDETNFKFQLQNTFLQRIRFQTHSSKQIIFTQLIVLSMSPMVQRCQTYSYTSDRQMGA